MLLTRRARAYCNWGRWVADCPEGCGSALKLEPHETVFACRECRVISDVEWPPDADEIWRALEARPAPRNRNWFPTGHELALRSGASHGQSVEDINEETKEFG